MKAFFLRLLVPFLLIDNVVDRFFEPPTELWSKLTGRTNVSFASVLVYTSFSMYIITDFIEGGVVLGSFAAVFFGFLLLIRLRYHRLVKGYLENPPTTIPSEMVGDVLIRSIVLVPLVVVVLTLDTVHGDWSPSDLAMVLYVWSWYALWQFHSGGKSAVKESMKRLTDLMAQAKGSLSPIPAPVSS